MRIGRREAKRRLTGLTLPTVLGTVAVVQLGLLK